MARKTPARAKNKKARPAPQRPAATMKASGRSGRRAGAKSAGDDPPQDAATQGKPYAVVGVGASAGGLEAFRELLKSLPADTGLAFALVQHLDPGHESMLARLLSKATAMTVTEVREGMAVEPNRVYVIPPNATMGIKNGALHLMTRKETSSGHMPIDYFLRSLAEDQGSRAIGVILSGTASDGTLGLKAIKAEGGITFAQDEKTAKYDGMPRSAVAAGCVDYVLPPGSIARELARIGRHPYLGDLPPARAAELDEDSDDELHKIFVVLEKATGVDFNYYKYSTIKRRIARRMVLHKLENQKQYLKFLRENPAEPEALCEDILIHVTSFFREPESFQALREWVLPKILSNKAPGGPIRIWVPGCSTGEEAYSIAMVLLEFLGDSADSTPIHIFGTDISEAAIEKARAGNYSQSSLGEVSAERLRRFFVKVEGGYRINKSVREICVFARQDLVKDAPFSRIDLISCCNVLIYMSPMLQKKVISTFHYALNSTGFLIPGKSEAISGFSNLFTLIDRKCRVCAKNPIGGPHPVFDLPAATSFDRVTREAGWKQEAPARFDVQREADRIVLDQYAPAGLIVNDNLHILHFRGQCSPYLSPSPGEATLSLLRMVRPEFAVDLRSAIHRAKKQGITVRKEGIRVQRNNHFVDVSLEVVPIKCQPGETYFLTLFRETPVIEPPGSETPPTKVGARHALELGRLRRELQTTKEHLQSIIEEQEATNEELKSANEEALSGNEELQSTNEELETAKEELQSTNEELVTVNEELQNRNVELGALGDDLANLLGGLNVPILMLSIDRRIRRFDAQAEKLLNLLPADVGRLIESIRLNIDVPDLAKLITEVVDTVSVREQEFRDLEGRWYTLRLRPYRTLENKIDGVVMVFVDIDALKRTQLELEHERGFTAAVLESAGALVMVTDPEGRIVRFNLACQFASGYSFEEVMGKPCWELLTPAEEVQAGRQVYRELLETRVQQVNESQLVGRDGRRRLISWANTVFTDPQGAVQYVTRIGADITVQRQAEEALQRSELILRQNQVQLRTLTAGLVEEQEEERKRLSRELHDDISQRLAALALDVHVLQQGPPVPRAEVQLGLKQLRLGLDALSEDVHRTARQLHPAVLAQFGLGPALRSYCEEFSKRAKIETRFHQRDVPQAIPPEVALALYRIVQEALGNAAKHAKARRVVVSVAGCDGGVEVSISDDGRGFDPRGVKGKGLGLISMDERVRQVGGTVSIESKPGAGARVAIRIPLVASPAGAQRGKRA